MGTVGAKNHIEEVERSTRAVKEGIMWIVQGFPFIGMPRIMVIRIFEAATMNLNSFLEEDRELDTISPLSIVA